MRAAIDGVFEACKVHARRGPPARARLHADPGLGDDAERALGAEHEALGARARAGRRQATRLEDARRA